MCWLSARTKPLAVGEKQKNGVQRPSKNRKKSNVMISRTAVYCTIRWRFRLLAMRRTSIVVCAACCLLLCTAVCSNVLDCATKIGWKKSRYPNLFVQNGAAHRSEYSSSHTRSLIHIGYCTLCTMLLLCMMKPGMKTAAGWRRIDRVPSRAKNSLVA